MRLVPPTESQRTLHTEQISCDLVVVGGGLAGTCCAITAARAGTNVTLIQDRPVLGGNASSEVRLWALGATAHMGNNNRWAREGGVINEIMVENTYRNPEGNPLILDTVILEKVVQEPNIRLLLNTALFEVTKSDADTIDSVRAFCSQNSTLYEVSAPLFCDASGDGVVGFLAGAAFRMGAESREEFGEKLAPSEEYGELLGHSIYFYTKDVGKPVRFVPPSFALDDITQIPRYRNFNTAEDGCRLWWIEYGGRLDTVHETETIKWELWRIIYGVWNYIKNSGEFPEAETMTLEWVGHIPGKRESRRFEGDIILNQQDVIEQRQHPDAVSFGGWALDLHPADGIYSEKPGCNQWHPRGVYQIPYRTMYSRNIRNLFLAGRIISVSHVAFGSTRVMMTCAHNAQAVGMAAAICKQHAITPAQVAETPHINALQQRLLEVGQFIPHYRLEGNDDFVQHADISASSEFKLEELASSGDTICLTQAWAQMLPVSPGAIPNVTFCVDVDEATTLKVELRTSDNPENHTPDVVLATMEYPLEVGSEQSVNFRPDVSIDDSRYVFVCLMENPAVWIHTTEQRITGLLSVTNGKNPAVQNFGKQAPTEDIGVDSFEFWIPQRRPNGQNLAVRLSTPLRAFSAQNIRNGWTRPTNAPNAWIADPSDTSPTLHLKWNETHRINRIEIMWDVDFDHPMESVLMTHPETAMPLCVKHFRILDAGKNILYEEENNYQAQSTVLFKSAVETDELTLECVASHGNSPAAVLDLRCYTT